MSDSILSTTLQLLCYEDGVITNNPHRRNFDFRRRMESIPVKNVYQNNIVLKPGQSFSLFQQTISAGLSTSSEIELKLVSAQDSVYELDLISGPGSFRTAKPVSFVAGCIVTVNNQALAVFEFTGTDLSSVSAGDIMRINGTKTYSAGPIFAFNPLNSGNWIVIGVSGDKVSAVREDAQFFEGISEAVADTLGEVQFYANDVVAPGNKITISNDFSPASFGTYEVMDATPTALYVVSAKPLPEESVTLTGSGITIFTSSKKMVYIEVNQECVVRFNGDSTDNNKITPIKAGDNLLVGFLHKWGETVSCEVVNKSVTNCDLKYFTCE